MKKDTIITLENGQEYILLDSTIQDNKTYFLAVGYDKLENKTNNDYKFFEEQNDNGEIYIQEVVNNNIIQLLLSVFTINYAEMIKEDINFEQN